MKTINLNNNLIAYVDDSNYNDLIQYEWKACFNKEHWYAYTRINHKLVYMHRYLMMAKNNKVTVQHKDNNTLNNRSYNLRINATKHRS